MIGRNTAIGRLVEVGLESRPNVESHRAILQDCVRASEGDIVSSDVVITLFNHT